MGEGCGRYKGGEMGASVLFFGKMFGRGECKDPSLVYE
jgi:hypothetical protein